MKALFFIVLIYSSSLFAKVVDELPSISKFENVDLINKEILKKIKQADRDLSEQNKKIILENFKKYFLFLGLDDKDFTKVARDEIENLDNQNETPSKAQALKRIFESSLQFLDCESARDFACIEKDPLLKSTARFRNPIIKNLGEPVNAGPKLEMEYFFNQAFNGRPQLGVAHELSNRIKKDGTRGLTIAMYGIDDVEKSMKPVYESILAAAKNPRVKVRAVVDVNLYNKNLTPWLYSYTRPEDALLKDWIFNPNAINFEYESNANLINELNQNLKTDQDARVRLEFPINDIMHNKFMVLEGRRNKKSVWTGTANISKTCMGEEKNSNMSVYIKNKFIAQAFLDEFNHMFNFDPNLKPKSAALTGTLNVGRFHKNKIPVSKRLFHFEDGTFVKVYFAPTDDAEHRAILPMLLSADKDDVIRISMFGGTGFEIVRAMQFALAKGAHLKLLYDKQLGASMSSWINDKTLNLFMDNPYSTILNQAPGTLEVKTNSWVGMNHYKVGTLTKIDAEGKKIAEEIIIGSQNWSSSGNDSNDENLISITNSIDGVKAAEAFNEEFDNQLFPNGKLVTNSK